MPFSEGEREVTDFLRGPIYCLFLGWCFMGVAMVADTFVSAIEAITSVRKKVRLKDDRVITKKVWNDTVANLSLMALGSSAPEIFLSFIELFKNGMYIGDLGPSTIAGSASFNLLIIVAVCIIAIPVGEKRKIKELNAFYVTAGASLFAYLWLVYILIIWTPDEIDLIEALITLGMLPVLIGVSYLMDVGDLRVLWVVRLFKGSIYDDPAEAPKDAVYFVDGDSLSVNRPEADEEISITIARQDFRTAVTCSFRTESFSAVPGYDYVHVEGTVEFAKGVDDTTIPITLLANANAHGLCREVLLIIEDPGYVAGGDQEVQFDPNRDGGSDCAILTLSIGGNSKERCCSCLGRCFNTDKFRLGLDDWKDQCMSVLLVNGSWEDQAEASKFDWLFHVITVPWNVLFCAVPPTAFFNGWGCFHVSLFFIAIITSVISDLAELFGCVLQIPDVVTAITFVALGTSMPDLFASLAAAKMDPTADAAIVNVTGSNCVNVFLGLGGPWSMAAFYWSMQERVEGMEWETRFPEMALRHPDKCVFVVNSRNLGFSVMTFSSAFCFAITILVLRRKLFGCELGGPEFPKWVSFCCFICMWAGWIVIVSWRTIRYDLMDWNEQMTVVGIIGMLELSICLGSLAAITLYWRTHRQEEAVDDEPLYTSKELSDDEAEAVPFEIRSSFTAARTLSSKTWMSADSNSESSRQSQRDSGMQTNTSERPQFVMQKARTRALEDTSNSGGSKDNLMKILSAANANKSEGSSRGNSEIIDDLKAGSKLQDLNGLRHKAAQPDIVTIIEAGEELENLDFPTEHQFPLVASSMSLQMVSHGDYIPTPVIDPSDSIDPGSVSCAHCCSPRENSFQPEPR